MNKEQFESLSQQFDTIKSSHKNAMKHFEAVIFKAYKSFIVESLTPIFSSDYDEVQTTSALIDFLKAHWQLVKGTLLSPTSIANHEITIFLCEMATYLALDKPPINLFCEDLQSESLKEPYVSLNAALPLTYIFKTHILSDDTQTLIPIAYLLEKDFLNHRYQQGLEIAYNPYSVTYNTLTPKEFERLKSHSCHTEELYDLIERFQSLSQSFNNNLLSHLETLIRVLRVEDAHEGRGNANAVGEGAFVALTQFAQFYEKISKAQKKKIPEPVATAIHRLLHVSSHHLGDMQDRIETCAGLRREEIEHAIADCKPLLLTIGLSSAQVDTEKKLILDAITRHTTFLNETLMLESPLEKKYDGFDKLGFSVTLLKKLNISFSIKTAEDVHVFFKLSPDEMVLLLKNTPTLKYELFSHIHNLETFILYTHQLNSSRLKVILDSVCEEVRTLFIHSDNDFAALFLTHTLVEKINLLTFYFDKHYNFPPQLHHHKVYTQVLAMRALKLKSIDDVIHLLHAKAFEALETYLLGIEHNYLREYLANMLLPLVAKSASIEYIQSHIKLCTDLHQKDKLGINALGWCASRGLVDVLKPLSVDSSYELNIKALQLAIYHIEVDATFFLFPHCLTDDIYRVEETFKSTQGLSSLQTEFLKCISFYRQIAKDSFKAVLEKDKATIVSILEKTSLCINAQDQNGNTAIHIATELNDLAMIKCFHEAKANLNLPNLIGETPLQIAVKHNRLEILDYLLENDAFINTTNLFLETPLMKAIALGHIEASKRLLKNNLELNLRDNTLKTALWIAVMKNQPEIVRCLIEKGADCSIGDINHTTPLEIAVTYGFNEVFEILLPNVPTYQLESILELAFEHERLDIIKLTLGGLPTAIVETVYQSVKQKYYFDGSHQQALGVLEHYLSLIPIIHAQLVTQQLVPFYDHITHTPFIINGQNSQGMSALMIAAEDNQYEVVVFLTAHGANLNLENHFGQNAAMIALNQGHPLIAHYLIEKGINIFHTNSRQENLLHLAAQKGDGPIAQRLIEGHVNVNCQDHYQNTPLHDACTFGHLNVAQVLVIHGASIEMINDEQLTPFDEAATHGHVAIMAYLIKKKPNLSLTKAIARAIEHEQIHSLKFLMQHATTGEILKLLPDFTSNPLQMLNPTFAVLLEYQKMIPLLIESVLNQDWQQMNALIATGHFYKNAQDSLGRTPLYCASYHGFKDTVELILTMKPLLNLQTYNGKNALMAAASKGHFLIAKKILAQGAHIDMQDLDHNTALMHAIMNKRNSLACYLIELNAQLNLLNHQHKTALILAIEESPLVLVEALLDKKASMDITNAANETPLMIAIKKGRQNVVRLLLDYEVNLDTLNSEHVSAVHIALVHSQYKIAKMLIVKGAKLDFIQMNTALLEQLITAKQYYLLQKLSTLLLTHDLKLQLLEASIEHSYENIFCNLVPTLHLKTLKYHLSVYHHPNSLSPKMISKLNAYEEKLARNLYFSIKANEYDEVKDLLVNKGATLSFNGRFQFEKDHMLYDCIRSHNSKMLKLLLSHQNDLWLQKSNPQHSPLFTAIIFDNVGAIKCLLESGEHLSIKNETHHTPHDYALRLKAFKSFNYIQTQLEAVKDFICIIKENNLEGVVEAVNQNKALIHCRSESGKKMVLIAASLGHFKICDALISLGASPICEKDLNRLKHQEQLENALFYLDFYSTAKNYRVLALHQLGTYESLATLLSLTRQSTPLGATNEAQTRVIKQLIDARIEYLNSRETDEIAQRTYQETCFMHLSALNRLSGPEDNRMVMYAKFLTSFVLMPLQAYSPFRAWSLKSAITFHLCELEKSFAKTLSAPGFLNFGLFNHKPNPNAFSSPAEYQKPT